MDVSENSGFSPQIIHFNRVFHSINHKTIHFGGSSPLFLVQHPYIAVMVQCQLPLTSSRPWAFDEAAELPANAEASHIIMFYACIPKTHKMIDIETSEYCNLKLMIDLFY